MLTASNWVKAAMGLAISPSLAPLMVEWGMDEAGVVLWLNTIAKAGIVGVYLLLTRFMMRLPWMRLPLPAQPGQLARGVRQPKPWWKLVVFLLFVIAVEWSILMSNTPRMGGSEEPFLLEVSLDASPSTMLNTGLLGPALEEVLFRLLVFARSVRVIGPLGGYIWSAFLFGGAHASATADKVEPTTIAGIFLALAYRISQVAWLPIALHAAHNTALEYAHSTLSPMQPFDKLQARHERTLREGELKMVEYVEFAKKLASEIKMTPRHQHADLQQRRQQAIMKQQQEDEGGMKFQVQVGLPSRHPAMVLMTIAADLDPFVSFKQPTLLKPDAQKLVRACFEALDKDGKGYLTPAEWASVQMLLPSRHTFMLAVHDIICRRVVETARKEGNKGLDKIEANMNRRLSGHEFPIMPIHAGALPPTKSEASPSSSPPLISHSPAASHSHSHSDLIRASLDTFLTSHPDVSALPLQWDRLGIHPHLHLHSKQMKTTMGELIDQRGKRIAIVFAPEAEFGSHPNQHARELTSGGEEVPVKRCKELATKLFQTYYSFYWQARYDGAFGTTQREEEDDMKSLKFGRGHENWLKLKQEANGRCTPEMFERYLASQLIESGKDAGNGALIIRLAKVLTGEHAHPMTQFALVRKREQIMKPRDD